MMRLDDFYLVGGLQRFTGVSPHRFEPFGAIIDYNSAGLFSTLSLYDGNGNIVFQIDVPSKIGENRYWHSHAFTRHGDFSSRQSHEGAVMLGDGTREAFTRFLIDSGFSSSQIDNIGY